MEIKKKFLEKIKKNLENFIFEYVNILNLCLQFGGASDEMGIVYDKITNDLEIYLQTMMNVMGATLSNCQVNMNVSSLIESITTHRRSRDPSTAAAVIQKVIIVT